MAFLLYAWDIQKHKFVGSIEPTEIANIKKYMGKDIDGIK